MRVRRTLPRPQPDSAWKVSARAAPQQPSLGTQDPCLRPRLAGALRPRPAREDRAGLGCVRLYTPCSVFSPEKANRFTEELADLQVEEKGTAVFACRTEFPAATVTWRKGLKELRASGKHALSQEGEALRLTIRTLEKADSDTYTCDIGQAQSQARLLVQGEWLAQRQLSCALA